MEKSIFKQELMQDSDQHQNETVNKTVTTVNTNNDKEL